VSGHGYLGDCFFGLVLIGPGHSCFLDGDLKANGIKKTDQVFKGNTSEIIGFVPL
jgi:hypothetical protein